MLKSIPTLALAANNAAGSSGKKKKKSRPLALPEEDDETVDEMMVYQSQIEQSVTRVSKTIRDIDHIGMMAGSAGGKKATKSNAMQFIEEQGQRLQSSIPLEYYTRQLNHKKVFRHIVEVDERVDFTAKNWKSAMLDYGLVDQNGNFLKDRKEKMKEAASRAAAELSGSGDGFDTEVRKGEPFNRKGSVATVAVPRQAPAPASAPAAAPASAPNATPAAIEETFEYDTDEMERLHTHLHDFVKNSLDIDDDISANELAASKVRWFREKALQHIRLAIRKERAVIGDQLTEMVAEIKDLDRQQTAVRKQLETTEAALRDRANTEGMIRQVVESRFRGSLQSLNEHVTNQNEKIHVQTDAWEQAMAYNAKVKAIQEELMTRRHKADPFVRKRAENLMKGLLKVLDEKETAIQKNREDVIRRAYDRIMVSRRSIAEMQAEDVDLAAEREVLDKSLSNHHALVSEEREAFRLRAKEAKEAVEDLGYKVAKQESFLAEHARAQRRETLLTNKQLAASRKYSSIPQKDDEVQKALSNEEYIQKMAEQWSNMSGTKTKVNITARRRSVGHLRLSASVLGDLPDGDEATSSSSSSGDEGGDGGEGAAGKRRNGARKHVTVVAGQTRNLAPMDSLCDPITEVSLGVTDNEEKRRKLTTAPLQPVMVFQRDEVPVASDTSGRTADQSPSNKAVGKELSSAKISFSLLSESESSSSDDDNDTGAHKNDRPALEPTAVQTVSAAVAAGIEEAPRELPVQSEMAAACYVTLYEDQVLRNPSLNNNYKRNAPRLQSIGMASPGLNQSDVAGNAVATTSTAARRASQAAAIVRVRLSSAGHKPIDRSNLSQFVAENAFMFDVQECGRVMWEVLSRLKTLSCIDAMESMRLAKELSELLKVFQALHADPEQVLAGKFKLHRVCVALVQTIFSKAPKVLLVANKKVLLVDVLQVLLSVAAVIMNCTLPFWQIPSRRGTAFTSNAFSHEFVEALNMQLLFVLLGGAERLSKDDAPSRMTKMRRHSSVTQGRSPGQGHGYGQDAGQAAVKPSVRRFSQLLMQNADRPDSPFQELTATAAATVDGSGGTTASPSAIVAQMLHIIQTLFSTIDLSDLVRSYLLILEKEAAVLLRQLAARLKTPGSTRLSPLSPAGASVGYEVEHYIILYWIEVFLFVSCSTRLVRKEKFVKLMEQIKSHAYALHETKSAFIADVPVLNVFQFDEFYMQIRHPEVLPAVLALNLFKAAVHQDLSKRLMVLNISGTNHATRSAGVEAGGGRGEAVGRDGVADLAHVSAGLPAAAELEMRALSRHAAGANVAGEEEDVARTNAIQSYAKNYLFQKFQIAGPAAVDLSGSTAVLRGADPKTDVQLEHVLAIPQTATSPHGAIAGGSGSRAFLSKDERDRLPKSSYEIHQKWVGDMRGYMHHLSRQIYRLLWAGVAQQHQAQPPPAQQAHARRRGLPRAPQAVLLPERLIYRVLTHVDSVHKVVNAFAVDGEYRVANLEAEFQACLLHLMVAQRKIHNIIFTITWPLRKKLVYLQNRYSSVLAENVNKINRIQEVATANAQVKADTEDIQRSIAVLRAERSASTAITAPGLSIQASGSLLQHSQNMQKLILDYITQENANKVATYKQKVDVLSALLFRFRAQFEELKIHTISLLNAHNSLYKTLSPELMRDELIREIYHLEPADALLSAAQQQLDAANLAASEQGQVSELQNLKDKRRKARQLRGQKAAAAKRDKSLAGSLSTVSELTEAPNGIQSFLDTPRLADLLTQYGVTQPVGTLEPAGDSKLKKKLPTFFSDDVDLSPEEVLELMKAQERDRDGFDGGDAALAKARERLEQHFLSVSPKLFSFGRRIETGLLAQLALQEQVKQRHAPSRDRRDDRRFLLSIGGHGFQALKSVANVPVIMRPQVAAGSPVPGQSPPVDVLGAVRGESVKIALPQSGARRFVMSDLPSVSQFVLDRGADRDLPVFTPLNLRALLELQQTLMAQPQVLVRSNSRVMVFDDDISDDGAIGGAEGGGPHGSSVHPVTQAAVTVERVLHSSSRKKHYRPHGGGDMVASDYKIHIAPEHSANIRQRRGRGSTSSVYGSKRGSVASAFEDGDDHENSEDGGTATSNDAGSGQKMADGVGEVVGERLREGALGEVVEGEDLGEGRGEDEEVSHAERPSAVVDSSALPIHDPTPEPHSHHVDPDEAVRTLTHDPNRGDPEEVAMDFHWAELARMERSLGREVRELIRDVTEQRRDLKGRGLPPSAYRHAMLPQARKRLAFIPGDSAAAATGLSGVDPSLGKKKLRTQITWPTFSPDWHVKVLRIFEKEDQAQRAQDSQLFDDIKPEDMSFLYAAARPQLPQLPPRRRSVLAPKPVPLAHASPLGEGEDGSLGQSRGNASSPSRRTSAHVPASPTGSPHRPPARQTSVSHRSGSGSGAGMGMGMSPAMLSSLLAMQHTHAPPSPDPGLRETQLAFAGAMSPPKRPRPSYFSPRVRRDRAAQGSVAAPDQQQAP